VIPVNSRDLYTGRQTQSLRDAGGSRTPNIFLRDDKNRCGRLHNLSRVFGNRGDLNVAELFQAELL
jgi:hypothetical protein